jgi:hypothetical protein
MAFHHRLPFQNTYVLKNQKALPAIPESAFVIDEIVSYARACGTQPQWLIISLSTSG